MYIISQKIYINQAKRNRIQIIILWFNAQSGIKNKTNKIISINKILQLKDY